jgi:hypothetical protein
MFAIGSGGVVQNMRIATIASLFGIAGTVPQSLSASEPLWLVVWGAALIAVSVGLRSGLGRAAVRRPVVAAPVVAERSAMPMNSAWHPQQESRAF